MLSSQARRILFYLSLFSVCISTVSFVTSPNQEIWIERCRVYALKLQKRRGNKQPSTFRLFTITIRSGEERGDTNDTGVRNSFQSVDLVSVARNFFGEMRRNDELTMMHDLFALSDVTRFE